jgi:hypothetical protein
MELSRFERVLKRIESRTERVSSRISKELGNVKPFDKTEVSPKERYFEYMNMTEESKVFARQNFPQEMNQYESEMAKLAERYQNG